MQRELLSLENGMRNGWRCWLAQGDNDGDSDLASGVGAKAGHSRSDRRGDDLCTNKRQTLAVVGAGEVSQKNMKMKMNLSLFLSQEIFMACVIFA
jgi:hypothetical protein